MQVFRQFIPQFAALAASMAAPAIGWVTGRGRWHAAGGTAGQTAQGHNIS